MNKDAAANSPVVTPVPPPANDINSNNHAAVKEEGEEPMETTADSKHTNDVSPKVGAVKTEVIESSRGFAFLLYFFFQLLMLMPLLPLR